MEKTLTSNKSSVPANKDQEKIKGYLSSRRNFEVMRKIIGNKKKTEKYLNGVLTAIALDKTGKLMKASHISIFKAVITAAQLGLEIDAKGYAYLIPFQNKKTGQIDVQVIPGYKGYIYKINNSPSVRNINIATAYEGDDFHVSQGTQYAIKHIPDLRSEAYNEDQAITHVYCVVHFSNGSVDFEIMTRKNVDDIRKMLKYESDFWENHYGEMARKTVVRRIAKRLQLSELEQITELDNSVSSGNITNIDPDTGQFEKEQMSEKETKPTEDNIKSVNDEILKLFNKLGYEKKKDQDNLIYGMFSAPDIENLKYNEKIDLRNYLRDEIKSMIEKEG